MGALFAGMGNLTEQDTIYTCLPIFHSAGGGIGVAAMMRTGATLCLARKFSAKRFWVEVATHNCTVIQYIGELCR
jgi:fatty-acyl-CoA synthase